MLINNPEQMEQIVKRNRNLRWDNGWDVIRVRKHPNGISYPDGIRIGDKWFRTERFKLTRDGWKLPDDIRA